MVFVNAYESDFLEMGLLASGTLCAIANHAHLFFMIVGSNPCSVYLFILRGDTFFI